MPTGSGQNKSRELSKMKRERCRKRIATLTLILILVSASNGFAQGSSRSATSQKAQTAPASDELLKAAEKAIAEAESLRKVKSLQADQIDALQGKIKALEDLVAIEKARAEAYKTAAAERATANTLDSQRIAIFEQSLKDFRAEVDRLRLERDRARRGGKIIGGIALVVGILAGVWVGRR